MPEGNKSFLEFKYEMVTFNPGTPLMERYISQKLWKERMFWKRK